jgi:signal transduction histidine kinase
MLADYVQGHRQELLRQVESREAADEKPGPAIGRHERIDALVNELIRALRNGGPLLPPQEAVCTRDAALQCHERDLVQHEVIEEIARDSPSVTLDEMTVLSDWASGADRRRLCEEYRRLSELLDEMYESAVIIGADGRVEYVNRPAARSLREATGLAPEQVLGKTGAELGIPHELDIGRTPDELVALARRQASPEAFLLGRWRQTKFRAVYTPGGDVSAVTFVSSDIHDPKLERVRLELLRKLSAIVGCLDCDDVAEALAGVPIPELADWCIVNMVENGRITGSFVAQRDPDKAALRDVTMRAVRDWNMNPLWSELRLTAGFQLLSDVSDDLLRSITLSEENYRVWAAVGVRSILVKPVVSRGQIAALLTLIYTKDSGRRYGRDDPPLAEELALHAAHIIENARLLRDVLASGQQLNETLAFRQRMMGVLGHDLGNPLNAVTMAAGALLRGGSLDEGDRGRVQVIRRAAKRMTEMIGTLLELTRVESLGALPVAPVATELGGRARDVVDEMSVAWPGRTIELEVSGDLHGQWDTARVEQAMSNLIANALQYGDPRRPVRMSIDGTSTVVALKVQNEGPLIPRELMPILFEPFTRGAPDTSPHGLGLGLFIAKQIALAHGGSIHVDSNADVGTVFTILLPRRP